MQVKKDGLVRILTQLSGPTRIPAPHTRYSATYLVCGNLQERLRICGGKSGIVADIVAERLQKTVQNVS